MAKNNMNKAIFADLREELTTRRGELIRLRQSLNESWQHLHEPETELEENASKETLSREMQQRSESVQNEIRNIDTALTLMAEGGYGRCAACRRPIRVKRLQAVPWARYCIKCAGLREAFPLDEEDDAAVNIGEGAFADDELRETIIDELRSDGRVESEELVITCEDGVVYLEGILPSEAKHQALLEIVQDTLDIENVVDSIRIDRQPWERGERRLQHGRFRPGAKDLAGDEGVADIDPSASVETGGSVVSPDAFLPEHIHR